MINRLPVFSDKQKICIICEGNEEYAYLDKLKSMNVWNDQYEISLDNAGGNGNIPARYQDRYQNGTYELVLIFCDTEKKPHEQYADIKRKVNEFHGVDYASPGGRIQLPEAAILESLWSCLKVKTADGLMRLMQNWKNR